MSVRDYSSFSSAAKSRFRFMAAALGYEQLSGILYARRTEGGWYEVFSLQASQYGSETFYINYGLVVPDLCPTAPRQLAECGFLFANRLRDVDNTGAFNGDSKQAIADSAARALAQYRALARPWYDSLASWQAIADEYLRINPIEEAKLGQHSVVYGADFRSATYGFLLLKAGRPGDACRWLRESERLLALPVYHTRGGGTVHQPEKGARLQKPDPASVKLLGHVRATLASIEQRTVSE